jgi:RecB family exonuclease
VGEQTEVGPARLSDVAVRAALGEALARAKRTGALNATADASSWPGFRRRLMRRFAAWTRRELSPDDQPPEDGPSVAEEWEVYRQYRSILGELEAEDAEGFATWASRALFIAPPDALRTLGAVTVFDLEDPSLAIRMALKYFETNAEAVCITLAFDPDPSLAEAFSAVAALRERLIRRGYVEVMCPVEDWRPGGLRDSERELFRSDSHARPPILDATGLALLGAPKGDGVGLLAAREVRHSLDREGMAAEDVLVLVRGWDDDAESVLGVLRAWGLPVSPVGRPRPLAAEPAVSALLMAMRLPLDGWETAELVRLLRHGQFRPDWEPGRSAEARARAAAHARDSGIFRGNRALRRCLEKEITKERDETTRRGLVETRALVDHLLADLEALDQPGSWRDHISRLHRLARALGLDEKGSDALDRLWLALDDHAGVLEALSSERGRRLSYSAFVAAVEGLTAEARNVEERIAPGTVVMASVDAAAGARARAVVLANLAEGAFPVREAVDAGQDGDDALGVSPAYSREMVRFLRVLGSADDRVVLVYPTRDEKGQEVLPAGFLDDLMRRVDPSATNLECEERVRLDPAFLGEPDLATAPADARVRAVGLACVRHDPGELARLATDPMHRPALDGAATALLLAHHRFDRREFTRYDGHLTDPAAVRALAARFGPERPFSPSQLESYLTCPYQFFLKYVLNLELVEDRDELDEDYTRRGSRIHTLLEKLEEGRRAEEGNLLELSSVVIQTLMRAELSFDPDEAPGLQAIETGRIERTLRRYIDQAQEYEDKDKGARPEKLEVGFGGTEDDWPCITLGTGETAVKVQGKIDRVDRVASSDGPAFRVIDYKTGHTPSTKDVTSFAMVQLPLYALAVERLALAGEAARLLDVGYWGLRDKGYKKIDLRNWDETRSRLEQQVLGAVAELRSGRCDVEPRKEDCTSTCDYRSVCRIGQVRAARKGMERDER